MVDAIICNAAVSACEKCVEWRRALALLTTMLEVRIWPDMKSYSAAISSCGKGEFLKFALDLLDNCKSFATVDTLSYGAAISACEKCGKWQCALELLNTMWEERV